MDKIQAIIEHEDYQAYLEELEELERERIFCLHNLEHFLAVARLAYILYLETMLEESSTEERVDIQEVHERKEDEKEDSQEKPSHLMNSASFASEEEADLQEDLSKKREVFGLIQNLNYSHEEIKEIIYAVGLLHDIGKASQYLTGRPHAGVSAELAPEILRDVGFDEERTNLITEAIGHHNDREGGQGLIAIIQEADKLSRLCFACQAQDQCYKLDRMLTRYGLLY